MISLANMAVFGDGYFPIENDLLRNGNLKASHARPKARKSASYSNLDGNLKQM
jgi:hypothetical protein